MIIEIWKFWKLQRADETVLDRYLKCIFQAGELAIVKNAARALASERKDLQSKNINRDGIAALEMKEFYYADQDERPQALDLENHRPNETVSVQEITPNMTLEANC